MDICLMNTTIGKTKMTKFRFSSRDQSKRQAEIELRKILDTLKPEQQDKLMEALHAMQKQLFFQEPWLLKKFSGIEQAEILAQFTKDEQMIMLARFDLELQHWRNRNGK